MKRTITTRPKNQKEKTRAVWRSPYNVCSPFCLWQYEFLFNPHFFFHNYTTHVPFFFTSAAAGPQLAAFLSIRHVLPHFPL